MLTRDKSKKRTAEAGEEISMEEKESTSVEDVETGDKEEARGGPDWNKFMELMNNMNEKIDCIKEDNKQTNEKIDSIEEKINEKLDSMKK